MYMNNSPNTQSNNQLDDIELEKILGFAKNMMHNNKSTIELTESAQGQNIVPDINQAFNTNPVINNAQGPNINQAFNADQVLNNAQEQIMTPEINQTVNNTPVINNAQEQIMAPDINRSVKIGPVPVVNISQVPDNTTQLNTNRVVDSNNTPKSNMHTSTSTQANALNQRTIPNQSQNQSINKNKTKQSVFDSDFDYVDGSIELFGVTIPITTIYLIIFTIIGSFILFFITNTNQDESVDDEKK